MNSQEAQQAQAIAEIKAIRNGGEYPRTYYREAIDKLLEIVDSQVQTIAADKKAMEIAADLLGVKEHKISESAKVIAELEKDIVRLEDHIRRCEAAGRI